MKFEETYKKIMENISTDCLGNSQPTGGVFSGDNFARGDLRVPIPMGMRAGARDPFLIPKNKPSKKKKKRRNGGTLTFLGKSK